MENKQNQTQEKLAFELVPGKFSKCYYCDVDNLYCTKYKKLKYDLGDYTWEYHCLKDGGCDKW